MEQQCEGLRQAHSDVLHDMSLSRTKEAELLAYTQQVTEKNVALQATLSSIEAKVTLTKRPNIFECPVFPDFSYHYFAFTERST